MKRLFAVLLIFSLTCLSSAFAEDEVKEGFKKTKSSLIRQDYRQRKVMASLYEINRRMRRVSKDKSKLTDEKSLLGPMIQNRAQRILELQALTVEKRERVRSRLAAIHMMGSQGFLRTLFAAQNAGDLDRSMKLLSKIGEKDFAMIKDYLRLTAEVKREKEVLQARVVQLQKLTQRVQEREAELLRDQEVKNKLLAGIRSAKKFQITKLSELRKKVQRGEMDEETHEFYKLLTRPSIFEQRGLLRPPVEGSLTRTYGYWRDKTRTLALAHKGHFYRVPQGTPVQAIFSGQVIFADWVDGFGRTVVVDHGDHYYTVYSHLSQIQIEKNQEVATRGLLGKSGYSREGNSSGVYFEVRHFSEATDPSSWFGKGQNIRVSSIDPMSM